MTVLSDINRIIVSDEVELIHLPENSKSDNRQGEINDKSLSFGAEIYLV
jgi:hypothetical protein